MQGSKRNARGCHAVWVALALFCCALITFTAMVQVEHMHLDGQTVQSDCAVCHAAHVVVQPPLSQSLPHTVWVVAPLTTALPPIRPRYFSVFSLFTRPPPVDIAFA